mgnify:CR=1 FL=1
MAYVIGVDCGTSGTKTVLFDEKGTVISSVTIEYPMYQPKNGYAEQDPGWSEQKPEDWWNAVVAGIKELTDGFEKDKVAGISFGGQMHGLVMLDKDDNVLRKSIIWCDQRTAAEVEEMNEKLGREKLIKITANPALTGWTAAKILWVKNNEPQNYEKCRHILLPKDYIRFMLTGEFATEVSDASGMQLLDIPNRCWSDEVLNKLGIDKALLAKVYESPEITGTITAKAAELTGLKAGTPVVGGAGDNAAAAVGTGTVGDGMCNISLGTSGTIFISSKTFGVDSNNALHSFDHADGYYHLMGCMLSAASCNKWWMDEILKTKEYSKEQEGITKLGENHVFYLPYLMGERSPHNDPKARATFIGMSMDTTREEMTQAVLEGVAFGLRDSLEVARSLGIKIERTKICGGGAKSPLWRQIIAAVMNVKLEIIESEEGPGYGAAILAAVGCGTFDSVEHACAKLVKVIDTVDPDPELVQKYEEKYQKFRQLYPIMKDWF